MAQYINGRTFQEYKAQIECLKDNSRGAKNQGRSGFSNCWKVLEREPGISMIFFSPVKMYTFNTIYFFFPENERQKSITQVALGLFGEDKIGDGEVFLILQEGSAVR